METVFNSNWFSVIIGVIVGSAINHVFWLVQTKRQAKQQIRSERLLRIDEICDFCSALIEMAKKIYGLIIKGEAIQYLSNTENFWGSINVYKTRMIVKFYFPKCIKSFDELQISSSELVTLMQLNMSGHQLTKKELDDAFCKIEEKTLSFQTDIINFYSNELCLG